MFKISSFKIDSSSERNLKEVAGGPDMAEHNPLIAVNGFISLGIAAVQDGSKQ